MKKILIKVFSYLLVTLFIAFLLYLIEPFFQEISNSLRKFAENIKNTLNMDINPNFISIILALIGFLIIYALLIKLASLIRKKADLAWDDIDPNIRYKSAPYTVIKILLIIIFIPFIYGYGRSLSSLLNDFNFESGRLFFFSLGFVIFSIVWLVFWKKFGFFSIFEHEFTHMVLALCFFHRPKAFYVDEYEGGWVKLAGVNFIITLGPYFFLTACFLLLPLYLIIRAEFYIYYFLLMGVFTSYHTLSTIRETNFNRQPDIIFNGKVFSFFVILMGNIFCYGYILSFVLGGFVKGRDFISNGWFEVVHIIRVITAN